MSEQVKPSTDWETIEKDWRAGIKTKLQMSQEYGVSRAAIDKHFAKLGIDRDLTEKIRARAESLVTQQAVTDSVTQERLVTTEREIVETNAKLQADVIIESRADIQRQLAILKLHSDELESDAELALPVKIECNKKMSDTLKTLVGLKRQAFGIAESAEGDKPPKPTDSNESADSIARKLAFILSKAANAG